jgi:ubiquinone/menaquinone biosynthesis C-methylase UbiE
MGTPWDARTYDSTSGPQQAWAAEVLARLEGVAQDATLLDVGCGTAAVAARVRLPLDYVRLNACATRASA